ncbi:STT3 domain-containing protein [Oleidesulfovibrio sp.]|uniref:STT3 domain-containing protein n=1 Tax=Oleidesulfovibrio sp. TaxID=2909707 RepID=UPI003A8658E4
MEQHPASDFLQTDSVNWKQITILCVAAYAVSLYIRLLELPGWAAFDAVYKGERLLATHDAYHWLAAATGFEFDQQHPLPRMLAFLHFVTGFAYGNLAFYLPAVMACLVAPLMVGWGVALGMPMYGFVAGVLTASAPGLMARTGLGYFDTDLLVTGALIINTMIPALWLHDRLYKPLKLLRQGLCRPPAREAEKGRKRRKGESIGDAACSPKHGTAQRDAQSSGVYAAQDSDSADAADVISPPFSGTVSPLWAIVLLGTGLFIFWQPAIHNMFNLLGKAFLGIAIILGGLLAKKETIRQTACGLFLYTLPAILGPLGLSVAVALWLAERNRPDLMNCLLAGRRGFVAALVLLFAGLALEPAGLNYMRSAIIGYSGTKDAAVVTQALTFPSVVGSIIEAQKLSPAAFLGSIHSWGSVAVCGLLLFMVLMLFEPVAALLLPMLAMGIGSMALGARFAMFASPCFAVGIAWGVHCVTRFFFRMAQARVPVLRYGYAGVAILATLGLTWPAGQLASSLAQGSIITPKQVEALDFIRHNTPEDSMLWYWWDWGYAAQYYARRTTVADGARHSNQRIYAPAAALTTDVPRFANQLIRYVAGATPPVSGAFTGMTPEQAEQKLHSFYLSDSQPAAANKQYLVVSAEQLRLTAWISRYGTWDFGTRKWEDTNVISIDRAVQFSAQKGIFLIKGMEPIQAESLTVFSGDTVTQRLYPHFNDKHFVIDKDAGMILIVDRTVFNSMGLQLLVDDGTNEDISRYFKLVFSNGKTKVFEVL